MREIRIVLFGLTLESSNKGCEALAYSFLSVLNQSLKENGLHAAVSSVCYQPPGTTLERDVSMFERINHKFLPNRKKSIKCQLDIIKAIVQSDLCVDFTDGDSFSDIYGQGRFFWRTLEKSTALLLGKRFLLGPQTYGPYSAAYAQKWAGWVVKKAQYVFSRDEDSAKLLKKIAGISVPVVTDIAMGLPADISEKMNDDKKKIGINISGLLWSGGYIGNNQFGVSVDYKRYIRELVKWCLKQENMQVYLIPHVIVDGDETNPENDMHACDLVAEEFPGCIIVKDYSSPMRLKGYISQMDIFTGARMHSTIAAFSSGVATIPFAYSCKFEGLFGALGYLNYIDGRKTSTEEALEQTKKWIIEDELLRENVTASRKTAIKKMEQFQMKLTEIIYEVAVNAK